MDQKQRQHRHSEVRVPGNPRGGCVDAQQHEGGSAKYQTKYHNVKQCLCVRAAQGHKWLCGSKQPLPAVDL